MPYNQLSLKELMLMGTFRCLVSYDPEYRLNYVVGYRNDAVLANVKISIPICETEWINHQYIIPVLRPFSSLTNDEAKSLILKDNVEWEYIVIREITEDFIDFSAMVKEGSGQMLNRNVWLNSLNPKQFSFLIEKEIDVYGWLKRKLAISQAEQILKTKK